MAGSDRSNRSSPRRSSSSTEPAVPLIVWTPFGVALVVGEEDWIRPGHRDPFMVQVEDVIAGYEAGFAAGHGFDLDEMLFTEEMPKIGRVHK